MTRAVSRVVLVHGFTQTARSWPREIVAALESDGHEVVAVDAPGHGQAASVRADLVEGARLLAAHGPAHFVGYSMGGRLALHVAVHHPDAVERLVLIGATPGIEDPDERAQRRAADEELAASIESDGVAAFLTRWLQNPLFRTLPPEASALDARLTNTVEGLASSLRLMGTGTQEPLWDRLAALTHPLLLISGALDEKFTELARRMAGAWGGEARHEIVAGAGHAVHLEKPEVVAGLITAFLHASTNAAASTTP